MAFRDVSTAGVAIIMSAALIAGSTLVRVVMATSAGIEIDESSVLVTATGAGVGIASFFGLVVNLDAEVATVLTAAGVMALAEPEEIGIVLAAAGDARFEKLRKDLGEFLTFNDESEVLHFFTNDESFELAF